MDNRPSGKRELNRLRNRAAILEAARECFHESGFDRVTIRDIIRRTDLAAGTFYNYFTGKTDIFAALLSDFMADLNERLRQLRAEATDAESFIHNTYRALFEATAQDPIIYELAHRNEQTIRELFGADLLGLAMANLEEDVKAAVNRGLFQGIDPEYLTAAFFGVAYELGLKLASRASDDRFDTPKETRHAAFFATHLFLGGMERIQAHS